MHHTSSQPPCGCLAIRPATFHFYTFLPSTCAVQEFLAICAHLPTELKDDLKKVAALGEETHRLTAELSRDQAEILEKAKLKYRQVSVYRPCFFALMHAAITSRWTRGLACASSEHAQLVWLIPFVFATCLRGVTSLLEHPPTPVQPRNNTSFVLGYDMIYSRGIGCIIVDTDCCAIL